jgi:cobalt-zinc-cadmium efflux system protein
VADTQHDNKRRVGWALIVTAGFMVVEAVGGWLSGSLALIADAGHMLTDSLALAVALYAFRLAEKPSDPRRSYGYQRAQVLAALANGSALVLIVLWIGVEAVGRLLEPRPIAVDTMLLVAVLGLLANTVAFFILHGGDRNNLNIRGATLHVISDLLGSVAAIIAAVLIALFGWTRVDPLLSLVVAALVLHTAWKLLRQSGHILLEGTPDWLDLEAVRGVISTEVDGVTGVHHMHAWCLTREHPLVTLHAELSPGTDAAAALLAIKKILSSRFKIDHSTIQVEMEGCADESINDSGGC